MRELTASEHGVVLMILASRAIAPPVGPIVAEYGEETVADLESLGLLVRWQSGDGERVTFTVEGAEEIGAGLADRLEWIQVEQSRNGRVEHRQEQSEEPYWHNGPWGVQIGIDRYGVPCPAEPGRWHQLEHPELIEAPPSEDEPDEYLLDEVSEQPIELFRGPDGTAPGVKVRIDKLRRKGAKKPRRRGPKRAG